MGKFKPGKYRFANPKTRPYSKEYNENYDRIDWGHSDDKKESKEDNKEEDK